ncbi:MAG TPA: single-stranded DNA-binding protein [Acidimicrobiia bacterium]|jgi:single-stranded DNA-binding protein|nr:single-stranded DNA-binding protein [Acidimicrobiia bacterium]
MDLNLVVLCGRLTTPGELRQFDSGTRMLRLLMSVSTEAPRRRTDVVPVTFWEPDDVLVEQVSEKAVRVWVVGSVQRRYWESPDGRRSRLEVVAEQVTVPEPEGEEVGT